MAVNDDKNGCAVPGDNRLGRTRPRIVVVIVVYSLQKGTHYYTRWRKYASEQKLTSSPLTVRVYALSTFADTTRLTPFGCNFLNACKPSGSKASAFHLALIAIGAFPSPSITKFIFSTYRGQLAIEILHVLKALAQHGFTVPS